MGVYQYPLAPAIPSAAPYARGGRAFAQPVIRLWMIGPRGVERVRTVLDPGAECCLFPEWLAWRVGFRQAPASPVQTMGSTVSQTGFAAWFETVNLVLRDPAGVHPPFRWAAPIGFTGRGSFAKSSAFGILGVNGGLDRFRRVEYDWSALNGPEVVIRT